MDVLMNFNDLMSRGGPIMWVIFFTAWLALVMLIERAIQVHTWISRANKDQANLDSAKDYALAKGRHRKISPVARIVHRIKWEDVQGKDDLVKQLNIHLAEIMPSLEGTLPTIAVLGSLLPMLGLLGTVVGMIEVFEVIAVHGTGNPQEMADGISQALLTTASGLIIAIPVIFFHHLLVRRLRYLIAVTEQSLMTIYKRPITG